jgi:Na+-transporting methylmalonyl-CoA/oxaloacetate decarboxylase gamma subunit
METGMNTGYAIALLGMAIVFCFIALLALAIHLLARFKGEEVVPAGEVPGELIAVIGAAMHAHVFRSKSAKRRDES